MTYSQMTVNSARIRSLEREWRRTESTMLVFYHVRDILEDFLLPSADKLHGDVGLLSQQDLTPVHTAGTTLRTVASQCLTDELV